MSPLALVVLAVAGGLGAGCRFVLDGIIRSRTAERPGIVLPWGTLVINLSGSFALGLLTGLVAAGALQTDLGPVLGAGFLGGYTTFSTASWETVALVRERRLGAALVHALGMLVGACVLAGAGLLLGTALAA